ncbi:hypothetical protein [Cellulomonas endophytica]|uniref:hypothetical protein n=1 Tax=Cellulomonas endophytica TaxID=2494735 RepID=UPI00101234AF|nr:hypothetical protein [Cellulomonas endophytica]
MQPDAPADARVAHDLLLAAVEGRPVTPPPLDDAAALAVGLRLRDEAATILRAADRPDELLDAVRALLVAGAPREPEAREDGGLTWAQGLAYGVLAAEVRGARADAADRLRLVLVVDPSTVLGALARAVAHVVRVHESPGGAAAYVRARAPRAGGR